MKTIIDFNKRAMKGYCKKSELTKQFNDIKEVIKNER